jgi:DNA-binding NarL/FixJ family response regulator
MATRYSRSMRVRVIVADDNLITREGIVQLLEPAFDVVASCGDLPEVLDAVDRESPDVVLTDIRMPPTHSDEGIRVANRLRETHPEVGVIVLSHYDEPLYALSLLESGSDRRGYLLKDRVHERAELRDAVHTVVRGGAVIDPSMVDALVKGKAAVERSALADLSPRERQVLAQIAQGKSNAAIADSLVLSKRAVEKHINAIFLKLGLAFADDVSKRVKAALMFLSESELAPPATLTDA